MTNEEKLKNRMIRKVLRIFIIIFSLAAMILAVLTFIIKISFVPALICLVIEWILNAIRNKIKLNEDK